MTDLNRLEENLDKCLLSLIDGTRTNYWYRMNNIDQGIRNAIFRGKAHSKKDVDRLVDRFIYVFSIGCKALNVSIDSVRADYPLVDERL